MDTDDLVLNSELNFDILDQDIADLDYSLQGECREMRGKRVPEIAGENDSTFDSWLAWCAGRT